MALARQPDLFLPDSQTDLLDNEPAQAHRADPDKIRARLHALLAEARAAAAMPWPERDARMWQIAFPQMTNWLPPDEAAQLRFQFAREMQRLARAA